jgi:uncharacterized protein YegP (UPF0339 family)
MAGKFVITKNPKDQYHFNLIAQNGKVIATSEMYPDKQSTMKGIASVVKNAPTAKILDETGEQASAKKDTKVKVSVEKEKVTPKTKKE